LTLKIVSTAFGELGNVTSPVYKIFCNIQHQRKLGKTSCFEENLRCTDLLRLVRAMNHVQQLVKENEVVSIRTENTRYRIDA
jgi:hypothetical protein